MKVFCFIIGLVLLTMASTYGQSSEPKTIAIKDSTIDEMKVIDTIINLKEVKERAAYVIKQTNGKRHLLYTIWQKPTSETPYYWVKIMEDNGLTYYTHFNFYVYPNSFVIIFLNTVNDKMIDLKT